MLKAFASVMLVVSVFSVFAVAQAGSGQIQGVARDPEGAAIPGASIRLRHIDTGTERMLVTDEAGRFAAPFMPVGNYSIAVESTGMAPLTRTGVVLNVGATLDVTLDMMPTGLQQQVTVVCSFL